VKGRHFVLALHDYYEEKARSVEAQTIIAATNLLTASPSPVPSAAASDVAISDVAFNTAFAVNRSKKVVQDKWALACINILYIQPLLEAFDDNGTGYSLISQCLCEVLINPNRFISITEANDVCLHWRLLVII
jgi:hypothetical protein